jgi:hypothetical protein
MARPCQKVINGWNASNTNGDNSFWDAEYYTGMHLYLAGQLYLMSVDVAEILVEEARRSSANHHHNNNNNNYLAGHEDHDVISMIQVATPLNKTIRWISMPRHFRFWEHPVMERCEKVSP